MRIWVAAAVAFVLCVSGAVLGAKPLLRKVLVSEAGRRGLNLEFAELGLAPGAVELRQVALVPAGTPFAKASLKKVRIRLSLSAPRLRSVEVLGGRIDVRGTLDDVRDAARELRGNPRPTSPVTRAEGRFIVVRDLELEWRGALGGDDVQAVRGFAADVGPGGADFGADWVALRAPGTKLELAGTRAHATRGDNSSRLDSVSASEARLSWEGGSAAPLPSAGGSAAKDDSKPGLLTEFPLNASLPERLGAARAWAVNALLPLLPADSSIKKLWVKYERGGERLELGPSRLDVNTSPSEVRVRFEPGQGGVGTPLGALLTVPRGTGAIRLEMKGGPVSLATIGIQEGSFGLVGLKEAEISGEVEAQIAPTEVKFRGGVELLRLGLESPRIAEARIFLPRVRWAGGGRAYLDGSFLELEDGELSFGEARFAGTLGWRRTEEHAELVLELRAPMIACQTMLDASPRGLLGSLEATKMRGTFGFDLTVDADTRKLRQMGVAFHLKNDCHIESVPAAFNPERFRAPFVREVPGPSNLPMQVESGPGSSSWAPFDSISRYFETALLVTEDGRFFRHHGFDERAIESSIRDNVTAGRFVRGASTISMQLAKNLYLERKKTLSRKLEESLLTSLLEQSFDKRGLLELYMNIIELGPGVYGIKDAARYYFNTTPAGLTVAQCFFLASLLPAPTRSYFTPEGKLVDSRRDHIHKLLRIAFDRERLTQSELDQALLENVTLGTLDPDGAPSLDEGGLPLRPSVPRGPGFAPSVTPGETLP